MSRGAHGYVPPASFFGLKSARAGHRRLLGIPPGSTLYASLENLPHTAALGSRVHSAWIYRGSIQYFYYKNLQNRSHRFILMHTNVCGNHSGFLWTISKKASFISKRKVLCARWHWRVRASNVQNSVRYVIAYSIQDTCYSIGNRNQCERARRSNLLTGHLSAHILALASVQAIRGVEGAAGDRLQRFLWLCSRR